MAGRIGRRDGYALHRLLPVHALVALHQELIPSRMHPKDVEKLLSAMPWWKMRTHLRDFTVASSSPSSVP
jgi:hypothetical protein